MRKMMESSVLLSLGPPTNLRAAFHEWAKKAAEYATETVKEKMELDLKFEVGMVEMRVHIHAKTEPMEQAKQAELAGLHEALRARMDPWSTGWMISSSRSDGLVMEITPHYDSGDDDEDDDEDGGSFPVEVE